MKISISMYSLASAIKKNNWSILDFIDYTSEVNFVDGVELLDMYWSNSNSPDQEINEVLSRLNEYGLEVAAYDVTNNFAKESANDREQEINKVIEGITIAKKLGTNILRVFCGDIGAGLELEQCKKWIIEGLKACQKKAEEEEVYLSIENHGLLAGKAKQVKEIIETVNSPYIRAAFDTGNFLLVDEDPEEALNLLKDYTVHVHFKDFRFKENWEEIKGFKTIKGDELIGVVPGEGQVNLPSLLKDLKRNHYHGWLSIEYEGYENADSANKRAVSHLANLIKKDDFP